MKKVKFDTKLEHEYINNYKCLQEGFKKVNVEKVIHIEIKLFCVIYYECLKLNVCLCFFIRSFVRFCLFAIDYLFTLLLTNC